ncbi:DUF4178 domain-containing protein [Acidovorax sp. RAC01]|uniref:DUF4178 domain-containing protein n=1 Tax=Acidovorax sp. RAC01 TaxID=1842533 RepID=UPI00083E887F|nr:DUF4178 domain-containing protein [Acidovorax sp. RAC01]AOG22603.1 hypothetical protein BSY15_1356 [Acidovorax sp. RAC01]
MASEPTQRYYRAPCPGCGAPVEFKSAQSTHAVCGYCQSTVVRNGDVLTRLGKMAEVFDDHSPLQLMASGRITLDGQDTPFTLVGRLQYKSAAGVWTEWAAFLDDGTMATLGEDNGSYVFTRPINPGRELPEAARFRLGATTAINGKPYSVASTGQASLMSAQGELPKLPPLGHPFDMVELRSADGEVLSIDYSRQPPHVERGKSVLLEDLKLQGLKDESAKEEKGRQFNCPHCGAPVQVQLASTKSITCGSCASIIDLGSGVGGELRSAQQDEPVRPIIPLGSKGQLQGVHWQVVGFQHRMGVAPGDDEHFGWSEYLLYNQKRGFAFLVDSEEGWSMVRPTTGAPQLAASGRTATYMGTKYELKYSYTAETTYVLGEFYWQVHRGQKTSNRDFASSKGVLSLEQSPTELTWSAGDKIASDAVAKAFNLQDKKDVLQRDDAGPFVAAKGMGCGTIILIAVILLILLLLLSRCSRCDPQVENCSSSSSSYRSPGGSYGGYSSGGSHK